MAFTVNDFADLKQLLFTHPEWRVDLRQLVMTDELLGLPGVVRELAEAQQRTEVRIGDLVEAQRRTETRIEALAEAQKRTETRIEELAEAQKRTEERLQRLEAAVHELTTTVRNTVDVLQRIEEQEARTLIEIGKLRGFRLEQKYIQRAPAYFGELIKRVRRVLPDGPDAATEDAWRTKLTRVEFVDLYRADAVISGILVEPPTPEKTQVMLALEISATIDVGDIERAVRRAGHLRKAGHLAIPVVAGESLTQGANELAKRNSVAIMLDGRSSGWEEAIAAL